VPGDPVEVAAKVIDSVSRGPATMRLVLGSDCYRAATDAEA
jgi:hypothetical protein